MGGIAEDHPLPHVVASLAIGRVWSTSARIPLPFPGMPSAGLVLPLMLLATPHSRVASHPSRAFTSHSWWPCGTATDALIAYWCRRMRSTTFADAGRHMTTAVGTLLWIAPEVLQERPYDCMADVYS